MCKMDRLLKPTCLLDEGSHEIFGQHLRNAGDIEDVLLRIQGGQLSARLRKRVDDLRRHTAHPGIKEGEKAGGASTDYRDVLDVHCHPLTFAAPFARGKLCEIAGATRSLPLLE